MQASESQMRSGQKYWWYLVETRTRDCYRVKPSVLRHLRPVWLHHDVTQDARDIHNITSCPNGKDFSLDAAEKGSSRNPSTNRPVMCPICLSGYPPRTKEFTGIWSYDLPQHVKDAHGQDRVLDEAFQNFIQVSHAEHIALWIPEDQVVDPVITPRNTDPAMNENDTSSAATRKRRLTGGSRVEAQMR